MDLSNIEKVINIDNISKTYIDDNDNFCSTNPLDEVNKYLSSGWVLLSIDFVPNDDHTSHIKQYILGLPKSNSSK